MQGVAYWPVFFAAGIFIAAGLFLLAKSKLRHNNPEPSTPVITNPDECAAVRNAPQPRFALGPTRTPPAAAEYWESRKDVHISASYSIASNESPPPIRNALKIYAGRLLENIPRSMMAGRLEHVEVRIADQLKPAMLFGMEGGGDVYAHDLPVVETMAVNLYSPTQAFVIQALSQHEQLVQKNVLINTVLDNPAQSFGRWHWSVTPLIPGDHSLALRIAARVHDSQGHPTSHTLIPDRVIAIDVKVNRRRWLWKALIWLAGCLAAALIGAAIQDQAWPLIRDALKGR